MVDVKDRRKKTSTANSSAIESLVAENMRLKEEKNLLNDQNKVVGVESLSFGGIWLPSPESRSGDVRDREKGRMLNPLEITYLPFFWVAWYLSSRHSHFTEGLCRINNELARKEFPGMEFVDPVVPDDLKANAIHPNEIIEEINKGSEFYSRLVKKYAGNEIITQRIISCLSKMIDDIEIGIEREKSPEKKAALESRGRELRIMFDSFDAIYEG